MKLRGTLVSESAAAEPKPFIFDFKDEVVKKHVVTSFNGKTGDVSEYAGSYIAGKAYSKGDIISYNGKIYLALRNTSAMPSDISDANWVVIKGLSDLVVCTEAEINAMWGEEE